MPYSSYDHDKLETAETMRIERRIYFEAKDGEIAPYVSLPLEQLHAMREESAAAEQAIFNDLSSRAAAWEEQAGRTLLLDKTLEYVRTPHVQHTANEWQTTEHNRHIPVSYTHLDVYKRQLLHSSCGFGKLQPLPCPRLHHGRRTAIHVRYVYVVAGKQTRPFPAIRLCV